jgi:hypothetical protein
MTIALLADITDIFLSKARHADFSPRYLYQDVRSALEWVHVSGALHNDIIERPHHYLEDNEQLAPFLQRLRKHGKTVFLLTNSPFKFVNAGMQVSYPSTSSSFLRSFFLITQVSLFACS